MTFPPENDRLDPGARQMLEQDWAALLIAGIVAVLVGVVSIAVPIIWSVGIAILAGIVLLVAAAAWLWGALSRRVGFWWTALGILVAVLLGAAGIWALTRPLKASVTITAALAVALIVIGVIRLAAALAHRTRDGWVVGLGGALSIVAGIFIASELPSSADWAIGLVIGVVFLVDGLGMIALALTARSAARRARPAPPA